MEFRALRKDEIDCRVSQITGKHISLLLYKNARVDMNMLDEVVGAERWQREHYECKNNMYCRVGIKCGNEWVYKSDCGTESNTEAEKGEASDSFKRACVNWGIGRELYTAPDIKFWINDKSGNAFATISDTGKKDKRGESVYRTYDKFAVEKIVIQDGKIAALSIINETLNCRCFVWQQRQEKP